jgi:hypothetical protein
MMNTNKIIRQFAYTMILVIGLVSCEKSQKLTDPVIHSFTVDKVVVGEKEAVTFSIDASADRLVIWTGSSGKNYNKKDAKALEWTNAPLDTMMLFRPAERGTVVSGKTFTDSYSAAGEYEVVLVARNVQDYTGDIKETIAKISVTVVK